MRPAIPPIKDVPTPLEDVLSRWKAYRAAVLGVKPAIPPIKDLPVLLEGVQSCYAGDEAYHPPIKKFPTLLKGIMNHCAGAKPAIPPIKDIPLPLEGVQSRCARGKACRPADQRRPCTAGRRTEPLCWGRGLPSHQSRTSLHCWKAYRAAVLGMRPAIPPIKDLPAPLEGGENLCIRGEARHPNNQGRPCAAGRRTEPLCWGRGLPSHQSRASLHRWKAYKLLCQRRGPPSHQSRASLCHWKAYKPLCQRRGPPSHQSRASLHRWKAY
ncbi:hypothetical protein NDU88_000095 [Pleurodeles waltl]|uniref:Uncharacterized protein n=1 Tax=Pleurodeles waltl TaxID=8319 RepID=A0AAV7P1H4_PLEWA|nr:hypothetical protein NDU88_000095 [Pleurodeles waltl]